MIHSAPASHGHGALPSGNALSRRAALAAGVMAGALHGLSMWAAFPPINLWPLALVAIVPLVWLATAWANRAGLRWVCLGACLGSIPFWLVMHRYLIDVTTPGWPPLGVYLSAWSAVFVALLARLCRTAPALPLALTVPVLWGGLEFLRGALVLGGYEWFFIGQPTIDLWGPLNPAHAGGVWLVSLVVAVPAGLLGDRLRGSSLPCSAANGGVLVVASLAVGWFGAYGQSGGGSSIRLGLVQTNMPQSNKQSAPFSQRMADYRRWLAATADLARRSPRPDVIAWPETMFMGDSLNASALEALRASNVSIAPDMLACADELLRVQREGGVPILMGAIATEGLRFTPIGNGRLKPGFDARFNSVFLVHDGVVDEHRYDKMELTPFGEMIPLLWRWPAAQQWVVGLGAAGMAFDLSFGSRPNVFTIPNASGVPVRIATPICFEAAFSRQCRRLAYDGAARRADLLLNVSNDGWFGPWRGFRETHLLMARWRCVELGIPAARVVNTGISCWIDPAGGVHGEGPDGPPMPSWVEGTMVADIPLAGPGSGTWYGAIGAVTGWACLGLTASAWLWILLRRNTAPIPGNPLPGREQ